MWLLYMFPSSGQCYTMSFLRTTRIVLGFASEIPLSCHLQGSGGDNRHQDVAYGEAAVGWWLAAVRHLAEGKVTEVGSEGEESSTAWIAPMRSDIQAGSEVRTQLVPWVTSWHLSLIHQGNVKVYSVSIHLTNKCWNLGLVQFRTKRLLYIVFWIFQY